MKKIKISFDFDSTLAEPKVQEVARKLIAAGYDVCILTTRYSDTSRYGYKATNSDLFAVARNLGIEEINFTEYEWKYTVIDKLGIDVHLDDNYEDEVEAINGSCKARAVWCPSFFQEGWENELYQAIKEKESPGSSVV